MAKQTIGIGSAANDGTGSTLRAAFDICNDNFTELYDGSGGLLHKIEGANFTGSLLVGHSTTGTLSSALGNTGVGVAALNALTSGDYNVAVGNEAGGAITSGERNVLMGYAAGDAITISSYNTAVGHGALSTEDTRHGSTAFGYKALNLQNADADPYNTAIGYHAAFLLTTGVYNTILGGLAGDALTTGNSNIAIGLNALGGEDTGHDSVAIGRSALLSQNYDGSAYNVAIGRDAGRLVDTGIKNTIIGGLAGDNLTTGSNNILIGYDATASAVGVSNEVTIGDSNISTVRIPSDSTLKIGASGDLQLEHVSSNSFIKNTAVGDLYIENQVDSGDVIFRSDDGSGGLATYFYLNGGDTNINFQLATLHPDNVKAKFGTSGDMELYHDGSHSYVKQGGTGDLYIQQFRDDGDIVFQSDNGSGGMATYFFLDGSNSHTNFQLNARWVDSAEAQFGNSGDFIIKHTGDSYLSNTSGDMYFRQQTTDGDMFFQCDDGSGGDANYLQIDGANEVNKFHKHAQFLDNVDAKFGNGGDLRIYHDGTSSSYAQIVSGDLYIRNESNADQIYIQASNSSGTIANYLTIDGNLERNLFSKSLRLLDDVQLDIGSSDDFRIKHTSANNATFIQNFTGDLNIEQYADDKYITFKNDDGSGGTTEYFRVDGALGYMVASKHILLTDTTKLRVGSSADLEIYHDTSNSYIENQTNDLIIQNTANDRDIILKSDDGSGGVTNYLIIDGGEVATKILTQKVIMSNLPTSDPSNAGQLYTDSGVLKVSAG
jgi:hypothetical protein